MIVGDHMGGKTSAAKVCTIDQRNLLGKIFMVLTFS